MTLWRRARSLALGGALLAAAGLVGCAGRKSPYAPSGSGGSIGCQTADCLSPASVPPDYWIEVDPPGGSTAAVSFFSQTSAAAANWTLQVASQVTVTATLSGPPSSAPASATAIVSIPSPIPGGQPVTFQAPATPVSSSDVSASLQVPSNFLGQDVTLTLVPLPPADQQTPPYTVDAATTQQTKFVLATTMAASIGGDNFTISGLLQSSNAMAAPGFLARAFQAGAQVSNVALTQSNGAFQLVVPSAVAAGPSLVVQLTPQTDADAWLVSMPFAVPNPPPGTFVPFPAPILLASYQPGRAFAFQVFDASGAPLSNAVVQAQTSLAATQYGQTLFARSGLSDANGVVKLDLLPSVSYTIAVIPPQGSTSATTCLTFLVDSGSPLGTATPPIIGPLNVASLRTEVAGQVLDAQGAPVGNVSITATPGPEAATGCQLAATATPPAGGSTLTDASGRFTFPLDQGSYQFTFDPPPGSAFPRVVQAVTVDGVGPNPPLETLPPATAVAGQVKLGNNAVPSATVQLYAPACAAPCDTPPVLVGRALTDANGAFAFATPLPPD